jgi:hypothetical protein
MNKWLNYHKCLEMMDDARKYYSEIKLKCDIDKVIYKDSDKILESIYLLEMTAFAYYLNSYEYFCEQFFNRKINKNRFIVNFKNTIKNLFNNESIKPFLYNNKNDFTYLIKFFETIISS